MYFSHGKMYGRRGSAIACIAFRTLDDFHHSGRCDSSGHAIYRLLKQQFEGTSYIMLQMSLTVKRGNFVGHSSDMALRK